MYRFKKFIQGPNLHEESVSRIEDQTRLPSESENLTGEEAKQVYEDIISIPSSSYSLQDPKTTSVNNLLSCQSIIRSSDDSNKAKPKRMKNSKLTLNQLMRLCESNNYKELDSYLEDYYDETDMDEQDAYGWTLLMSAACAGSNDCVKLLLQARVDWNKCDKKGFTAFQLAKKNGRKDTCKIIQDWERFAESGESSIFCKPIDYPAGDNNQLGNSPIYCEACEMNFLNQTEHLKSIAHLFTSGVMSTTGKIHYGIPESNKGFQMMIKTGWDKTVGLGPKGEGQKFPVKTVLKRDREGVGNIKDKKAARITHFGPFDPAAVENPYRLERATTQQKREKVKRHMRERRKEINFRRELGSL